MKGMMRSSFRPLTSDQAPTNRQKRTEGRATKILSFSISGNGGSPGLVVMGDDSCSRGHGFESRYCILDGFDITLICC